LLETGTVGIGYGNGETGTVGTGMVRLLRLSAVLDTGTVGAGMVELGTGELGAIGLVAPRRSSARMLYFWTRLSMDDRPFWTGCVLVAQ
jgi:hypothetical protein